MRDDLFAGKPEAASVYDALCECLRGLGPYDEQVKKTSIHLARKSAFAGVHPRKTGILLVVRTRRPIDNPRIRKREQVSANRWHNELLLGSPSDVDGELSAWLADAYALSGP